MFATLDFYYNLILHHAEKNRNVIYRLGRSVLKNILSRSQKRHSAFGLGTFLRVRQNIFPVRTSHSVNNIYLFHITRLNVMAILFTCCYVTRWGKFVRVFVNKLMLPLVDFKMNITK